MATNEADSGDEAVGGGLGVLQTVARRSFVGCIAAGCIAAGCGPESSDSSPDITEPLQPTALPPTTQVAPSPPVGTQPGEDETRSPLGCLEEVEPIGEFEVFDAILDDLRAAADNTRPHLRYLTLTHLHNVGYCAERLDIFREALTKAIHLTNNNSEIKLPKAIGDADAPATIYRIDLRDYNWETIVTAEGTSGVWDSAARANPQAYVPNTPEAVEIIGLIGSALPFMQTADAFMSIITTPPVYYEAIGAPSTLTELEERLGFSIDDNVANLSVTRFGTDSSSYAVDARVMDRHVSNNGVVWIAYDFVRDGSAGGQKDIFSEPVIATKFADSVEVIYELPNGFHGYGVFDALGMRRNVVNSEIHREGLDISIRGEVVAGLSCLGCHDSGIRTTDRNGDILSDDVKPHILTLARGDQDDAEIAIVEAIYPDDAELAGMLKDDEAAFLARLGDLGTTRDRLIGEEGIYHVWRDFQKKITEQRAAAELNVDPDELFRRGRNPLLQQINGRPMTRSEFQSVFKETLCQVGKINEELCRPVASETEAP